ATQRTRNTATATEPVTATETDRDPFLNRLQNGFARPARRAKLAPRMSELSELTPADKAIASLLRRLDVQADGVDAYVGESSNTGMPRLFGGLVAGQATVACARTVTGMHM